MYPPALASAIRIAARHLLRGGYTIGTAESCTAGGVAAALATPPGASAYLRGGVVAYSDEVKEQLLHVDRTLLETRGAVNEEVAQQMAQGVRRLLGTDIAIATTGVAGPTGGTPATPVGTIWLCVSTKDGCRTQCLTGDDGRRRNTRRAVVAALSLLTATLTAPAPATP